MAAGLDEDFGFAELGHGQADRARFQLQRGDLRRLMRLGVRTQLNALGRGECRHVRDIMLQLVDIDDQRRRIEIAFVSRHQKARTRCGLVTNMVSIWLSVTPCALLQLGHEFAVDIGVIVPDIIAGGGFVAVREDGRVVAEHDLVDITLLDGVADYFQPMIVFEKCADHADAVHADVGAPFKHRSEPVMGSGWQPI